MPQFLMAPSEELKLRELAVEIAKDIYELDEILKRLGLTHEEYNEWCLTSTFKSMLNQAVQEWNRALNTPKRVKLKAAVNIENGLPDMYTAMTNPNEPLSSRVKVFEIMARIGGLGAPDPVTGQEGSSFNLTIQLDDGRREIVIEHDAHTSTRTREEKNEKRETLDVFAHIPVRSMIDD